MRCAQAQQAAVVATGQTPDEMIRENKLSQDGARGLAKTRNAKIKCHKVVSLAKTQARENRKDCLSMRWRNLVTAGYVCSVQVTSPLSSTLGCGHQRGDCLGEVRFV
ncbi:hypothetical protein NQ315_007631 [Exocentrus adspersus]|uniref:Uncharacterized protein n=1 Tax=Exocentrus adspersus TaxID=1586481 RepID=A0AAV8W7H3_9CUCU|nr:hypothetical protein NQ315_007631 [Exocentrus adspersus]